MHVDLVALPLERRDRERHRDRALLLLGIEVAHGVAVLDAPHPRDRAGDEQQRLGQRRLPGSAVADERDVADLRRRERLHAVPPGSVRLDPAGPDSTDPTRCRDPGPPRAVVPRTTGIAAGTWYPRSLACEPAVTLGRCPDSQRTAPTMLDGRWRAKAERGPRARRPGAAPPRRLGRRAHGLRSRRRCRHRVPDRQRQPRCWRSSASS